MAASAASAFATASPSTPGALSAAARDAFADVDDFGAREDGARFDADVRRGFMPPSYRRAAPAASDGAGAAARAPVGGTIRAMAKSPSSVADAHALLAREKSATLCTLHAGLDGWPFGSVVPYAVLPSGDPVVFLSDIAEHTKNLERDPRASLFLADPDARERPQTGARMSMLVRAHRPSGAEERAAEEAYFARFPSSAAMRGTHGFFVWVLEVDRIRWIAGFGSMGWIARAEWTGGADPLAPHAAGIVDHMNRDHADAVVDLVAHLAGLKAASARVVAMDRGGFDVEATDATGASHEVRLPFDAPVSTPAEVRKVVMAMVASARKPSRPA